MSEGPIIVGGYELKNCIASGKTTQIWEVTEQGGSTQFAMKLMLEDARKKPEEKAVLKHEFKVGKSLEHPGIVRFHKIEINRDHAFFIMDFFRAPSLKLQITTNLPEIQSRFAKVAESVCAAMAHVHEKGWLHRDIKPDNILVNKTGETRIIDFSLSSRIAKGIGKLVGGKSKVIQGTRTYISPEAILRKHLNEQTDVYSFGVTLFELATGVPAFAGLDPNDLLKKHLTEPAAPPSALNPNVTSELDQVILKMLAKKPKDRYADMREVQAAIRTIKCFKEDPLELHDRSVREAKELETISVDKRLDSRADADRTTLGLDAPAKPTKGKRKTAPIGKMEPVVKKGGNSPAHQQPPAQQMQPMMQPFAMPQPMMMPPMMPQPMFPPSMMPGQMMPGQMMPSQPGFPGMPPGQMPAPNQHQVPVPVSQPSPIQPPVNQPPSVPQAVPPDMPAPANEPIDSSKLGGKAAANQSDEDSTGQQKAVRLPLERRSAQGAKADEVQDLDFMTELPDIL